MSSSLQDRVVIITGAGSGIGRATSMRTDVTVAGQVADLVRATVDQHGQLDEFFANAGGQTPKPTLDTTPDDFLDTVEFNLAAVFLASDEASYVNGVCLPVDGGTSSALAQPSTQLSL